jgi:DNA-binding IclR family transcriptional regulator
MKTRRGGYAYSDQEVDIGARAVAAPILNDELRLIAGLCVAGPVQRMDDLKIKKVTKRVIKYAKDISEDLTKQGKSG